MSRDWTSYAEDLADQVTYPGSPWRTIVATTPRHVFVPRWWQRDRTGWVLRSGPSDQAAWMEAAYSDRSLVTSVDGHHADHAEPGDRTGGRPTSSATLPSLLLGMFEHAHIGHGSHGQALDVGTGSGYGTALLCARLGDDRVTSVDVDAYLVRAARERLKCVGFAPCVDALDATGELERTYDRIVATVGVRPVPPSWLRVLRTQGRLAITLAGTSLIITADKGSDGGAQGRVEWDRGGFMPARHDSCYPPGAAVAMCWARDVTGEDVSTGLYPVVDVAQAWDLASMLDLAVPGVEHEYRDVDGRRRALMAHHDGSWARAEAQGLERPTVHQGGPRRLWDELNRIREYWLAHGELPVRGAQVYVAPDGRTVLARGDWHTVIRPGL